MPYRVMVVDDSAVIRGFITRALEADAEIKVVESASNGQVALKALERSDVDVIVLDIEMPVMDGMTALPRLLRAKPGVKIIMASTLTRQNAAISLGALAAGASDYIPKPTAMRDLHSTGDFQRELATKVKALVGPAVKPVAKTPGAGGAQARSLLYRDAKIELRPPSPHRPDVVAIGSSTGGPQALCKVFEELKNRIKLPIFITQHMPPTFTAILAEHIHRASGMPCEEASDGDLVRPGHVYVAPGDFHMVIEREGKNRVIHLNKAPAENFCRPSVDPMLRSIAKAYGPRVLTVILTGMGHDGLDGCRKITETGGTVIAQDEETSVVWGMPGAVLTAGLCSAAVPINRVAPRILKMVEGGGT